ncbi:hypothetical protein CGT72_09825 [Vibrio cholerae]|uniref:Tail sheath protein (P1-like gp22) n=1 Tax=Vibrio vulnificus TaxID=672 RepID=A0AAI8ZLE5_VIBVL|nr:MULTISPECIES: hypothetical protein [Vibrio]EKF9218980.1 hypothetical protein [Vibrio cholerae]OQK43769.1 hypothetical protein XM75_u0050 [Vibrio vulnificus]PAS33359.1 hypothetical protein CGT72_09825 [Vibrio cholerae]CDM12422.1 tail sheath protein (P1-like gp22) [Vibrio vulnificus]
MSGMISKFITEAAGISVLPPIDNNFTTGGGDVAVGACAVIAPKGAVGKIITVTADNWEETLGRPLPMKLGTKAEGLRHLKDALDALQYCHVVRVVADDAKYPSIALPVTAGEAVKSAHVYGTSLSLASGHWLAVFPIDGDPSVKRRMVISDVNAEDKRFTLSFQEQINGEWQAMAGESYVVGVDVEDTDDSGLTAYLPNVLEERSGRFRAEIASSVDFSVIKPCQEEFVGGTNGGEPTLDNWKDAWNLLKTDDIDFNLCFAAGNYDPSALAHMITIADGRLAQFRFDVPPWLTEEAAKQWLEDANLESYQASCFHYPYKATDEWYGGKSVWGLSGGATAAKAKCFAQPTGHAAVKGAHFTAAGEKRGTVNRRGIEPLHLTGKLQPTELVKARINPVSKGKIINDCLNVWHKNNYLRFEHTTAILNDLCHEFLQAAAVVQFEPDGFVLENLQDLADKICKKRFEAGAFVEPRNPSKDGKNPYRITLKQVEIDYWHIEVAYAQTGVARRIAIQPRLMA